MHYLKSLAINFLFVFFSNHILPGINVMDQTKLPHIGGDLIMAFVLGALNTLIYPVLSLCKQASLLKIAIASLILNFIAYGVVRWIPIGIAVTNVKGYMIASVLVAIGGFLTNFVEMKRHGGSVKTNLP